MKHTDVTSLSLDDAVTLLPNSVKVFLTGVLTGKKHFNQTGILGQALMQAAHTQVLTLPLRLGLLFKCTITLAQGSLEKQTLKRMTNPIILIHKLEKQTEKRMNY